MNEAIIFRHFPSKEELYEAVINRKCRAAGQTGRSSSTHLASASRPMEVFRAIGEDTMRRCHQDPRGLRLLLFSALQNHELSSKMFRTLMEEQYSALACYIGKKIAEGVFRDVDPTLAARAFLGMIWYELVVRQVFNRKDGWDPAQVASAFVDIWFRGVLTTSTTQCRDKRRPEPLPKSGQ